jgi:dihydrofolate reductase
MAKLVMWNVMTLDGFFEGTAPWSLDFHETVWGPELERLSIEQLDASGGLLFGRRTYEGMAKHWTAATGPIAERMNAIPKTVVSRTLARADWSSSRILREVSPGVAELKRAAKGDLYVFGSAELSATLLAEGLFDELRIGVAPLLLGAGTRLFRDGSAALGLDLVETRRLSNGGVLLFYRPRR